MNTGRHSSFQVTKVPQWAWDLMAHINVRSEKYSWLGNASNKALKWGQREYASLCFSPMFPLCQHPSQADSVLLVARWPQYFQLSRIHGEWCVHPSRHLSCDWADGICWLASLGHVLIYGIRCWLTAYPAVFPSSLLHWLRVWKSQILNFSASFPARDVHVIDSGQWSERGGDLSDFQGRFLLRV